MGKMEDLMDAVGALCEIMGLILEHLQENGFTREEAVTIVSRILSQKF